MDEVLTTVASEQVQPAGDTQQITDNNGGQSADVELDTDLDTNEENEDGDDLGGDELDSELVDVEYEGKVHKLPPELKDALLRNADYTRKTQEVAEQRRTVEARQAEVNAAYDVSQEVLQARAAIINVDGSLEQFKNVDWQKLEQDDPFTAQSLWRKFQQLREQRGQIAQYLDKTQADLSEKAQQAVATRLRETKEFAQKELKGWTPELDNKITEFATKELGFTPEQLREQYNPQVYRTMYLAHIGHQTLLKQNQQPKPKAQPGQPTTTVKARGTPISGLDDRLSADEWLKRRNAQVRR